MLIKPDKIDFKFIFWLAAILLAAYGLMQLSGCAAVEKIGTIFGFGKTLEAKEIIYIESPLGWGAAVIFAMLKVWFWRKSHVATKAVDRVVGEIEDQHKQGRSIIKLLKEKIEVKGKQEQHIVGTLLWFGGYDSTEHFIRSRIRKNFPKHKEIA